VRRQQASGDQGDGHQYGSEQVVAHASLSIRDRRSLPNFARTSSR
jgi:hypothetical protein